MTATSPEQDMLERLGWTSARASDLGLDLLPGRVAQEHRGSYVVFTGRGEMPAQTTGRLKHEATSRADLPAVGDWVGIKVPPGENHCLIHQVLPRASAFSRKVAGTDTEAQIVAANVDIVFLVSALNQDLNPRRVERYLTMAWESGATPVIVANKADLSEDLPGAMAGLGAVSGGCDLHAVSAVTGEGFDGLASHFSGARTVALLGSSGVGKSTIVNRLLGAEVQVVRDIRGDGKGRHTTTHRELHLVPGGGSIIDTPGMRELQLWDADEGLDSTFQDIVDLAAGCRFADCSHGNEPGCEVLAAVADGRLAPERLQSYHKLGRELAFLARKKDKRLAHEEAKKWKRLNAEARSRTRHR